MGGMRAHHSRWQFRQVSGGAPQEQVSSALEMLLVSAHGQWGSDEPRKCCLSASSAAADSGHCVCRSQTSCNSMCLNPHVHPQRSVLHEASLRTSRELCRLSLRSADQCMPEPGCQGRSGQLIAVHSF